MSDLELNPDPSYLFVSGSSKTIRVWTGLVKLGWANLTKADSARAVQNIVSCLYASPGSWAPSTLRTMVLYTENLFWTV